MRELRPAVNYRRICDCVRSKTLRESQWGIEIALAVRDSFNLV
jgi:hypothetical protein